jgi:hypothetical protein
MKEQSWFNITNRIFPDNSEYDYHTKRTYIGIPQIQAITLNYDNYHLSHFNPIQLNMATAPHSKGTIWPKNAQIFFFGKGLNYV